MTDRGVAELAGFLRRFAPVVVLTGAGCSTDSGIPGYRDDNGDWKHARPVTYADFIRSSRVRRRYWARSIFGWQRIAGARPNAAHRALAALEAAGHVGHIITQNVDGLHQRAGSSSVIDLHGRLDSVECLGCGATTDRSSVQSMLVELNPDWAPTNTRWAPDGDVDLGDVDYEAFRVPDCAACGGMLKPHVVFFGESVPAERVRAAMAEVEASGALLVVGSSLMVFSGYRFSRRALLEGKPVAVLNLGRTRIDDRAALKIQAGCAVVLRQVVTALEEQTTPPAGAPGGLALREP